LQLLFTLLLKGNSSKKSVLLNYNTDSKKGDLISVKGLKGFVKTSGIVYSGNYLCVGIQYHGKYDKIVIFDLYSDDVKTFQCEFLKNTNDIVSIYPGKLYANSQSINSICCMDFDSVNLEHFRDDVYYILDKNMDYEITSLYNYKSTWFLASQLKRRIMDLSNDRIVYSDIDNPVCLFFNYNHRLCFIENGKSLFHCGDDIFKVRDNPTCAIEDCNRGGYWIVCDTDLIFINYDGDELDKQDLSSFGGKQYYNIIESKGRFVN